MKDWDKYLTKTMLKNRGWTEKLIRDFMPEPDLKKENPNPNYKRASLMKLYKIERVESIEKQSDFQIAFAEAKIRSQSALKGIKTKMEKLIYFAENVKIILPYYDDKIDLYKKACANYNHYNNEKHLMNMGNIDYYTPATIDSDRDFLDRITVNYLRHVCTNYEEHLEKIAGKAACHDAYKIIRERVDTEIIKMYPYLGEESYH